MRMTQASVCGALRGRQAVAVCGGVDSARLRRGRERCGRTEVWRTIRGVEVQYKTATKKHIHPFLFFLRFSGEKLEKADGRRFFTAASLPRN